jgi:hypothetical protein
MHTLPRNSGPWLAAAVLLAGFGIPASAQTNCFANVGVPPIARVQGDTELGGDITFECTGGTPTPAGNPVPQINITVILNTNFTSKVTQPAAGNIGIDFSEALLLMDEPNRPNAPAVDITVIPGLPLLNCGNKGAPDTGPSGPGVCEITSTGNPAQTYDGTPNAGPAALNCLAGATVDIPISNVYGCGRPNVFQARLTGPNTFVFSGVPFDPPAAGKTRQMRITNVRVNAAFFAGVGGFPAPAIRATITTAGAPGLTFGPAHDTSTDQVVAYAINGLFASAASSVVTVREGFAESWKYRNISDQLANATFSAGHYVYNGVGATNNPVDAAQNVPGILYNDEEGFNWQNNSPNGPPNPDPPAGYGPGLVTNNSKYPLFSYPGYHAGYSTHIDKAGVADAGTRIGLTFFAPGENVTVPNVVYLHPTFSPATISGVMVLTLTDSAGAGPFNPAPGTTTTIFNQGLFVYEVLYADPFSTEMANVPFAVTGGHVALVYATFAPFYTSPSAGFATPTAANPTPTAIPRFTWDGTALLLRPAPRGRDGGPFAP